MSEQSFTPRGDSLLIIANTSAPTGVQVPEFTRYQSGSTKGSISGIYRIYNSGSVVVSLGWGNTAGEAQTNSELPTAGTPQQCLVIPAGTVELVKFPEGVFLSGKSSALCNVYVVQGRGN